MEQHPVPQHIASFEFKLFGNLTIRQFFTLAIPASFGILVFFSNIAPIVRIPTAIVFIGFGLFAALVPIDGRPLDKWLVAFIKAVLSPTRRVWVKEPNLPEFLLFATSPAPMPQSSVLPITAQDKERLENYLRSLPEETQTPLDIKEQMAIKKLGLETSSQAQGTLPPAIVWPTYENAPESANLPTTKFSIPKISTYAQPFTLKGLEKKLVPIIERRSAFDIINARQEAKGETTQQTEKAATHEAYNPSAPTQQPMIHLASEINYSVENVIPIQTGGNQVRLVPGVGGTRTRKLHFAPPAGFDLSKLPIRGERRFEISEELKRRFGRETQEVKEMFQETNEQPKMVTQGLGQTYAPAPASHPYSPQQLPTISPLNTRTDSISVPQINAEKIKSAPKTPRPIFKPQATFTAPAGMKLKKEKQEELDSRLSVKGEKTDAKAALLSKAQIVPLTNTPNVLSGLVLDTTGGPIEGAILTVLDQNGIPIRALKTNKLGQFLSATALASGNYIIETESDIASFEKFNLKLDGKVLEPLAIKAKGGIIS